MSAARRVCGRVGIALSATAPSTADRPARSRDRYDIFVASKPEALDDQSRQPGTRCARVCSPSTVEGLGNVSVELGAAAGTSGPSLTPAASPKRLSTRPTRPHDYPTKRCTRVLIFAPPARRLRFEQLQGVGQPTAPVAPLQSTKKGTGKLAARRKWRPLARFGSMTRGSSGGATQIRQARGGIKNFEVMWYMGLKKGPLNGLLWVFRVFLTARGFTPYSMRWLVITPVLSSRLQKPGAEGG